MFALGRAQELCILLETYWERMNLKVPIYFTMGLTGRVRSGVFGMVTGLYDINGINWFNGFNIVEGLME